MGIIRNLVMEQGATFRRVLTILDSSGCAVDLAGQTFSCEIRHRYSDSRAIDEFAAGVEDSAGGQVSLYMAASDTMAIYPGRYVYGLQSISSSSASSAPPFVTLYMGGELYVTPEATR